MPKGLARLRSLGRSSLPLRYGLALSIALVACLLAARLVWGVWSVYVAAQLYVLVIAMGGIHLLGRRMARSWGPVSSRAFLAALCGITLGAASAVALLLGYGSWREVGSWALAGVFLVVVEGLVSLAVWSIGVPVRLLSASWNRVREARSARASSFRSTALPEETSSEQ